MPSGTQFIKHEFDEAIAIQRSIVDSATKLSTSHPVGEVKRQIKAGLRTDERHLRDLQKFGKPFGAYEALTAVLAAMPRGSTVRSGPAGSDEVDAEAWEAAAPVGSARV
jgi:hypothetical protein